VVGPAIRPSEYLLMLLCCAMAGSDDSFPGCVHVLASLVPCFGLELSFVTRLRALTLIHRHSMVNRLINDASPCVWAQLEQLFGQAPEAMFVEIIHCL
jgi:hypothetical protein